MTVFKVTGIERKLHELVDSRINYKNALIEVNDNVLYYRSESIEVQAEFIDPDTPIEKLMLDHWYCDATPPQQSGKVPSGLSVDWVSSNLEIDSMLLGNYGRYGYMLQVATLESLSKPDAWGEEPFILVKPEYNHAHLCEKITEYGNSTNGQPALFMTVEDTPFINEEEFKVEGLGEDRVVKIPLHHLEDADQYKVYDFGSSNYYPVYEIT